LNQLDLAIRGSMQEVDIAAVRRQPSMHKAVGLCVDLAGFKNDKDFCRRMDIDPGVWARIKSGEAHFPSDRFADLFDLCGNEVPLIWLADRRGYELVRLESELERELRLSKEQNARLAAENELLRGMMRREKA